MSEMVTRRSVVMAMAASSGCSFLSHEEADLMPEEPFEMVSDDEELVYLGRRLDESLREDEAWVRSFWRDGDALKLFYGRQDPTREQLRDDISRVSGNFAGAVHHGLDADALVANTVDVNIEQTVATFYVLGRYARMFMDGEINSVQYYFSVIQTLETEIDDDD